MTSSISVLTLDSDDVREYLNCDERRARQIMGMAVRGKFTESIMDSFWNVIDTCDVILEHEDKTTQNAYEKIGKEMENTK